MRRRATGAAALAAAGCILLGMSGAHGTPLGPPGPPGPRQAGAGPPSPPRAARFMLLVHGGAGTIRRSEVSPEAERAIRAGLTEALRRGYEVLARGGRSLDAVTAAIVVLEDSPWFNAGRGAVFTSAGTHELDAAIMDGRTLAAGAVAGVKHVKNPIRLARLVMERSPHVLLVGDGAEAFARAQGVELVPNRYFDTERRRRALEAARQKVPGTVGAVALDSHGDLAAGTSTGGTTNKLPGRVGDSPIIGAGTYANNASCAVSATGHGEDFIRRVVAHDICARVAYRHQALGDAVDEVVLRELPAAGAEGGVIALDAAGRYALQFNTEGMYRGYVGPDGTIVVELYR